MSGNSGDGVHVRNGGRPEVRGNEITASEGHGLHICRAAAGVYDGNQVLCRAVCALVRERERASEGAAVSRRRV